MRIVFARRALAALLLTGMLLWGLSAELEARTAGPQPSTGSVVAQVVVNPVVASNTIGPARYWDRVDPAYRYYYGPNYSYDPGWYATRHLAHPNNYVAYATDPSNVCSTEYYYMPSDGVYYCYEPDPVAQNSNLQGRCANQAYLYFCPNDLN